MEKSVFIELQNKKLYYREIYLENEQPELFSLYDDVGGLYLAMLLDEEIGKWLKISISSAKLREVKYGNISIRDAFLSPELNALEVLTKEENSINVESIKVSEIPDEYLPAEYVKLNWQNIVMPVVNMDTQQYAEENQKDIIDLRLISKTTLNHTIDSGKLGELLTSFNSLYKSIALHHNRASGKKRNILSNCGLNVANFFPGSFGIRLEGEASSDLLGYSNITPIINELFNVLNEQDDLLSKGKIKDLPLDVIKSYRKLLKFATGEDYELSFSSATPKYYQSKQSYWQHNYSVSTLTKLDTIIKDEKKVEIILGRLIGITKKNYKFDFLTDDGDLVSGVVDPSLKNFKFTVDWDAAIKVEETIKINNANETEVKFKMLAICDRADVNKLSDN